MTSTRQHDPLHAPLPLLYSRHHRHSHDSCKVRYTVLWRCMLAVTGSVRVMHACVFASHMCLCLSLCAGTLARARAFLKHTASPPSPPSDSPHRWSGHLHRVARILLPFTLDPQDVIPALLRGCSEHEASIDCGLTLTSHAWSVCGGAPPPPAPAERDVTVPVGPRGWTTMTSCAGDPARHWTLVYAATPRPAPPGAVCVCVCAQYSVSQWSFEGGWEVGTQEGWCTGWVRHWERTCARLGGELLSVSQLPPLQLP